MSKYALNHFLRQNQTVLNLSLAFEMVKRGADMLSPPSRVASSQASRLVACMLDPEALQFHS